MTSRRARLVAAGVLALMSVVSTRALATEAPAGQMSWALHFSLAPTLFEPAETAGLITPFMIIYALHDALVKPMPEKAMAPGLAESWSRSPDGLVYEFVLRKGTRFHNGEPVTAEDVKFSFERYRGASAKLLKDRVREVQIVDPGRVRFHLKAPGGAGPYRVVSFTPGDPTNFCPTRRVGWRVDWPYRGSAGIRVQPDLRG